MADDANAGVLFDRVDSASCRKCGCAIDVAQAEPLAAVKCSECGEEQPVPARFGPFRVLSLIGTGGMGGVYHAKDESLDRFVAIKVMLKSVGEKKDLIEKLRHEAQAAAQLNHPNVAQIYSFGEAKGLPYIVMELVSGRHLDRMIEGGKRLGQAQVMRIGIDIAEGLKAASDIGLIHGDIKPENILLDEKKRAKLIDFGIATYSHESAPEGVWGTPYYIAPEKVRRQKIDARADIYSLGATLFHALAGRPPFDGKTPVAVVKARLKKRAPLLSGIHSDLSSEVCATIARMLETEPSKRYPTYASLISDMRKSLESLDSAPGTAAARTKGKKLVMKKKGARSAGTKARGRPAARRTGPQTKSAAAPAPEPQPEASPGPKAVTVIPGGGSPVAKRAVAKAVKAPAEQPPPAEEPARHAKPGKPARDPILVFFLWLCVFLVLIGVSLAFFVVDRKKKKIAVRKQILEYQIEVDRAKKVVSAIESVTANAHAYAESIDPLAEQVDKAVMAVLGEKVELPKPVPKKKAGPIEKGDTAKGASGKAPARTAGGRAVSEPRGAGGNVDSDGREAPFGMPTLKEFKRGSQTEKEKP